MKSLLNYLLLGFLAMLMISFSLGLLDDAFVKLYYKDVWHKDIIGALVYYVLWVLPYWWPLILIGTLVLAFIIWILRVGIRKLI